MSDKELESYYKPQYQAWGVMVRTSQVRGAHIANGLVQLLRLFPNQPVVPSGKLDPTAYIQAVVGALDLHFGKRWLLSDEARALCVTASKEGPLTLEEAEGEDSVPDYVAAGREHVKARLTLGFDSKRTSRVHETIKAVLNSDERVYAVGGSDPTTPGLVFAGYTTTHTLRWMHAATFLGLLCRTPNGAAAASSLYALFARQDDPHSQLVRRLGLGIGDVGAGTSASFLNAYPCPTGGRWDRAAERAATLTGNLLAWSGDGKTGKAEALMGVIDLAALLLFLHLVQWRPPGDSSRPLLLMASPLRRRPSEAIARAQQSLLSACGALDRNAREQKLCPDDYRPSVHVKNLGAAGGWLFPVDSRGAPRRWFAPGHRQLGTFVRALVPPKNELTWAEFSKVAEESLGIIVGGPDEARVASALGLGGGANSVREVGRMNREHLVALGLARQESDNVIVVDGGGQ